ncbi:cytochrome o ubiquinol oxidase subunit IV, partial [Stenotrophomonas maltophilia]|uniref:cytochrome o ubiquinol oxidase subunit IV n=1 Tax=Stenotrophomonas maltophilia TaxID=40324 RepID=UPI0028119A83
MAHDNHAHDHGTGGESHGTVKSYLIGFVLAVVLTVIPFWMVMSGDFSRTVNGVVIAITAVLQMLVHLVFFLHLGDVRIGTRLEGQGDLRTAVGRR